ncbi:DEAD/DEAH box helicase family protein [Actinomyces sp. oral taxon 175]|uniref:DEAD/DEAH box helicase family protein n=1 Tax=Actinomyces sp. oral taxon 175 TaxID=712119 RepID=UPI00021D2EA2|nr:DEAD/DEAH box helicase family protein [Actinomyces sp. oral taxon 175]EGV12313.1 type III restriction enzyme, res subunit [Actinomyces sp. oral taxon 175 str. F0384]
MTSAAAPTTQRPLRRWTRRVPLRDYQQSLLDRLHPDDGSTLHLLAPPGSGKTLMGLELAVRNGRRALVLVPTTVIGAQWIHQARKLFTSPAVGSPSVTDSVGTHLPSARPEQAAEAADLTVLTYQSLAVVDSSPAWSDAARSHWLTELTADGRSAGSAEAWLKRLEADNPRAYNRGLRARATTIRRQVDELDDDAIDSILGPGARARLDALVTAGVATIVLDECHHLKAHWAIVVHYLVRRLKRAGLSPTLIGLTATEPSGEDRLARRYRALLGDVDAEVPVPAVIRAGHLAPCRQLAWFTLPSTEETTFLATAGEELHHRVGELLLSPDGIDYLLEVVAPPISSTAPGGGSGSGPLPRIAGADDHHVSATAKPPEEDELVRRIVAGFDADPLLAASAAALLRKTGNYRGTALSTRVVPLLPELDLLDLDDELRLLGRYAHDRLLAAPERRRDWESTRELLRGFGLYLTDSGIRAGRSPVDTITAASRAKDTAVVDILRHELDSIGERLRAVVVTDAAEHSAPHRALDVLGPASRPGPAGGAARCMSTLLSDADLRSLHPVLLTSSRLSLASGDTSLLDRLRRSTGLALPATDDGWMLSVTGQGVGSAGLVLAVSELVTAGEVRLVVGTRGLLGEGWDCPAVNTLIDLTAATTSASTQQLRGRTMRLDPGWVDKVAHNWSVTCLLPSHPRLRSNPDLNRLRRKAEHLWSLVRIDDPASAPVSASGEPGGAPVVETGLDAMLPPVQRRLLDKLGDGAAPEDIDALNSVTLAGLDRQVESRRWLAQAPAADRVSQRGRGRVLEAVDITSAPALLRRGSPTAFWSAAARAVLDVVLPRYDLTADGDSAGGPCPDLVVRESATDSLGGSRPRVLIGLDGVGTRQSARFADILTELLSSPVRRPRFILEAATATLARGTAEQPLNGLRRLLGRLLALGAWNHDDSVHLAVPTALARSRADMEAFLHSWSTRVGPCRLHLVADADDAAALLSCLGSGGPTGRVELRRTRRWMED